MRKYNSKYLWGALLILIGIFVVLRSFDIVDFNLFFTGWWTMFIIIPSLISLIFNNNRLWDGSVLIVGLSFFAAANRFYITYDNVWAIAACLFLINIGISIMRGTKNRQSRPSGITKNGTFIGIFSGCNEKPVAFDGGTSVAIFGNVELDLRDIVFTNDVYLTGVSVFGTIDIYVNDNINVVCSTANIFGGTENEQETVSGNNTLYIDGCNVFGGLNVKKHKKK